MHNTETKQYDSRDIKSAMKRGWHRRCPNCGEGDMMNGYLAIHDKCSVCAEELHHHRADDGPAYITILLGGHILGPLMLLMFELYRPDPLLLMVSFSIIFIIMGLYFLPRIKGAFIAMQWARRMHGFGGNSQKV